MSSSKSWLERASSITCTCCHGYTDGVDGVKGLHKVACGSHMFTSCWPSLSIHGCFGLYNMGLHFGNLILHVYHSVVLKSLQNLMLVLRFHSGPLKIKFENTQKNSLIFSTISNLPLYVKYLLMTYASLNIALLNPFFFNHVCAVVHYAWLCMCLCASEYAVLVLLSCMYNLCALWIMCVFVRTPL